MPISDNPNPVALPPPTGDRERDVVLQEILNRALRTECRLTQLMLHMGMTTDGRNKLEVGRPAR